MIKKVYRLKEREVKKVLKFGKPFFSYGIVLNKITNKLPYNRFGIILGSKSVNNNITRNFFRRRFYDLVNNCFKIKNNKINYDIVLVVKKKVNLDKKNKDSICSFDKDINFVFKKGCIN